MRFTHLKLKNWRNFKDVDVALQDRVFIMGPNASGKSNLLDLFRFLRDLAQEQGGLKTAVDRVRGGFSAIRSLHATKNPNVEIEVHVGDDERNDRWVYELVLGARKTSVEVKRERVLRDGRDLFVRPNEADRRDVKRLSQTHMEQVSENEQFRPLVEFFAAIDYIHLVPQLLRDPERYKAVAHDPFGADFLDQIARTAQRRRNARLRRINRALKIALPQFDDLQFERDEVGKPHLKVKYKHWRSDGGWQREHQFSDGTLRLIGLLWVLTEGTAPLLLEEPELSLHSEVVRQIPRMMSKASLQQGRQILVSTHSESLVDDEGVSPNEILVLTPSEHETHVTLASTDPELVAAAESGARLGPLLVGKTRPEKAELLGASWDG